MTQPEPTRGAEGISGGQPREPIEWHQRGQEWVGYEIYICTFCQVPWPCDVVRDVEDGSR